MQPADAAPFLIRRPQSDPERSRDRQQVPAAQAARDWARALSDVVGLPAAMWDERLSSSAVNRFLIEDADLSRARRAAVVDRAAAAWMLQSMLDVLPRSRD